MKTWIVSSLDEETIQGEETIWGNTVFVLGFNNFILEENKNIYGHAFTPSWIISAFYFSDNIPTVDTIQDFSASW